MKFRKIFLFEIGHQLRRPSTWIYFATIVGVVSLMTGEIADDSRNGASIKLTSPFMLAELAGYANKFGFILIAALAADGVMRDIQARMDSLIYTSSVSKFAYLGARFAGSLFIACILLVISVPLSLVISQFTQDLEPVLFGEFRFSAFINSALFLIIPNVFVATGLMYAIVLFTRSAMAAYVGGLILFVLSTFTLEIVAGNWTLAKLIDPSGITIINILSRSLTPLQANTETVQLKGFLLVNRCLWLAASLIAGGISYSIFKLSHYIGGLKWTISAAQKPQVTGDRGTTPIRVLTIARSFDYKTRIYQIRKLALTFYAELLSGPAVLMIPAMALYAFVLIPNLTLGPLGVPMLPLTDRITMYLNHSALQIFVVMFITFFAGQLIWREQDSRLNEISDAVPASNTVMLFSKYLSLALIIFTLQLVLMVVGMLIQVTNGYYQFNILLYLQMVFGVQLVENLMFAGVAMAIHVIINQKYVSHLIVMFFYVYTVVAPRFGVEHKLLIFGSDLGFANSFFYDQSPFILPWVMFKLYWAGWTLLLLVIAKGLWARGRKVSFSARFQEAFKDVKNSRMLPACLAFIILMGGFIFYNTNILNEYHTRKELIRQQVDYEKQYGKYRNTPQPNLTSTRLHIEFYPEQREAVVNCVYQFKNYNSHTIDTIHIDLPPDVETTKISFDREVVEQSTDDRLRHHIYALTKTLHPGDSLQLNFSASYQHEGFSNDGLRTAVMNDGTWFGSDRWLPALGYQAHRELDHERRRRQYGLPGRTRIRSLDDENARYDRSNREKITFEAVVGTSPDQIGIAPGSLKETWSKDGRKYFRFVPDAPIRNMFHIYSANYQIHKTEWKGTDIEMFYNPENILNLKTFEQSIIASIDYYSKHFSPYPFRQIKFVEYSDPGIGGISLPGTIGYSTNFSWLNPEADRRKFNLPFAVTAHEVAHQWWGHQLVPADVEGRLFLTESLAWYSALSVVEFTYGKDHLDNLLDAMRVDFLRPGSRAGVPLLKADDQFLAYRKGPLAMYALREYVGDEAVNLALTNLLKRFQAEEPPFATSLDFYKEVKAVTGDSLHYLLNDLFETNTFWELETKGASIQPSEDGSWLVALEVVAKKVQVDKEGIETEVPMNDLIEVGIYKNDNGGKLVLHLKKERIHSGINHIVVKLSQKPDKAGIDPRNLLIDTDVFNNVREVTERTSYKGFSLKV